MADCVPIVENDCSIYIDSKGEITLAENVGNGEGVYAQKTGLVLQFKSLTSDSAELTISSDINEVTFTLDLSTLALKSNVLELDNTDIFTPDADYQPATKKYVDDNVAGLSDHGSLNGLGDDDHPQYLLENGGRELSADWFIGDSVVLIANYIQGLDNLRLRSNDGVDGVVVGVNGGATRVGLATDTLTYDVNVGGNRQIGFQGSGTCSLTAGSNFFVITGSPISFNATESRFGGDAGGARVNIKGYSSGIPLGIQQASAGNEKLISLRNSSSVEVLALTVNGGFSVDDGNSGVYRYKLDHVINPASATGDGVGLNFRTENKSGTMDDCAYIDTQYSDILNDKAELRFFTRTDASNVTEKLTIKSDGKVGIGNTDPDTILDINGALTIREKSSDPADPDEGSSAIWMSDGTGSGDDGDIMIKITAGGVTKTTTLVDFSAI